MYVAAGRPGDQTALEVYDPSADRWSTLPAVPLGRSSVAGAAFGGKFLVIGGERRGESTIEKEVDAYDPGTRRWSRLPDLPAGRQGIGAVVIGGRLYLPGGGPTGGGSQQTNTLLILS